jgi:hypothetical protein
MRRWLVQCLSIEYVTAIGRIATFHPTYLNDDGAEYDD